MTDDEGAAHAEMPDEVDARPGVLEAAMEKIETQPLIYHPTEIGQAGAFVTLDRYGTLAVYRGYDHLTSDESIEDGIIANEYTFTEGGRRFGDTWEGSTHLLQNIQNVRIFCTNGDPDHA